MYLGSILIKGMKEFGKPEYYSVLAPKSGQSSCRNSERLYFDKSPSFGYINDFTDCDVI